jgi:hypothetical protein
MTSSLPGVLGEIAAVAGDAAALNLAARVGGTRVYIPARVDDSHWLTECVGRRAADQICKHFAIDGRRGQRLDVPLAAGTYSQVKRMIAKRVHELDRKHMSSRAIARAVGVTQRTVHKHRAAHRGGGHDDDDKQGRLL